MIRTRWILSTAFATCLATTAQAQLNGVVNFDGFISMSVDAEGNNSAGTIRVDKPDAAATVRAAYLSAASNFFRVIANGQVSLAGTAVNWDLTAFNNAGGNVNFFHNTFADVTAIVKPLIDPLGAGIHELTVTESSTDTIDGTVLAVIFDDPSVTSQSGIIILFGGQNTTGDQFIISLAQPLDLSDPGVTADMGLGISFSFQGDTGTSMVSLIDVNSSRLTSSAGGEDDGGPFNGGLITVGGIDDLNTNPPPFDGSTGKRTDDELYSLLPFVTDGDTQIVVDTFNPTDDDNVFFGYFVTSVPISVDEETIFVAPLSADLAVGCNHTVTATVENATTQTPIVGRQVDFEVIAGPNIGQTGSDITDGAGEGTFTYAGTGGAGTDTVVARMINGGGAQQTSNQALANWSALLAEAYCFGTGCPCGNDDGGAGCRNGTGAGALLSASGSSSVLLDDLVLTVTQVPADRFGILYMGGETANVAFGGGIRCVGPGVPAQLFRYHKQTSGGGGVLTEGPGIVQTSIIRFPPAGEITACSTWYFQGFYRDKFSDSCGTGWNLSNGMKVTFGL